MADHWKIIRHVKRLPKLTGPVFIEGLPGIGNVGKITVDYLIDELKAKKLYSFFSYTFPHSVFVNEHNLVELPSISMYYVKTKGKARDYLFLAGDIQPTDETSSYMFCEIILEMLKEAGCKEIVTIGGIGLIDIPKEPGLYCTANSKDIIKRFQKHGKINNKIYGVIGPIIGVTGVLVGMAQEYDIEAISLLAETFGHPMHLGIKGSREILKVLKRRFRLSINLKHLDSEVAKIEKELIRRKEEIMSISEQSAMNKACSKLDNDEAHYIG